MQNPIIQQVIETLRSANNVLITVKSNPSVDELTAAISLTLLLNHLDKNATTVFSGQVPSTIEFLQPEMAIESNTDSLRDFIIALDKAKADKLRYKVEDDVVRIFITPYKSSITENDLEFSQGELNVDVVVALGVLNKDDFDQAILSHGKILHDATVIAIGKDAVPPEVGSISWQDQQASSISEMVAGITELFGPDVVDSQIATALMTGIVSETDRFKNSKTTPEVLSIGSKLMAAGANQQLIAERLEGAGVQSLVQPLSPEQSDSVLSVEHPVEDFAPGMVEQPDPVLAKPVEDVQKGMGVPESLDVPGELSESDASEELDLDVSAALLPTEEIAQKSVEDQVLIDDSKLELDQNNELDSELDAELQQGEMDALTDRSVVTERTMLTPPMNSNANRASVHQDPSGLFGDSLHRIDPSSENQDEDSPLKSPSHVSKVMEPLSSKDEEPEYIVDPIPGSKSAIIDDAVEASDNLAQSVPDINDDFDTLPKKPQTLQDLEKAVNSPHVASNARVEETAASVDNFMGTTTAATQSLPDLNDEQHGLPSLSPVPGSVTHAEPVADVTQPSVSGVGSAIPPVPPMPSVAVAAPQTPTYQAPAVPPPLIPQIPQMPQIDTKQPLFFEPDGTQSNPLVNPVGKDLH